MNKETALKVAGKHIVIVEGPSGAGKSTLLEKIDKLPHVKVISQSLGKRSFKTNEAALKSFSNDMEKLMRALVCVEPVVFIDRCMISQLVYHAIRTDREVNSDMDIHRHTMAVIHHLEKDLSWRIGQKSRDVTLYWLFLVPRHSVIHERRHQGGKEYPNSVHQEFYHYKKASGQMLLNRVPLLRPCYDAPEDTDFIVRAFEYWLRHYPYLSFEGLWRCFATLPKMQECVD